LKDKINEHLLKSVLGPGYLTNPNYEIKKQELLEGRLEEYTCFLYIPGFLKNSNICQLKVKDIRKYMYEIYIEELFVF